MILSGDISSRITAIRSALPQGVELVAVSKFHPLGAILEAAGAGQRLFGESRVQELERKVAELAASGRTEEISWHFIGHLQTNKVKHIAPYIAMIEAVDSLKLLKEINRQAEANNRVIKVLLELHIAEEDTKYGLSLDDCRKMLEEGEWRALDHVCICGIMMMASNVDDEGQIRSEFSLAASFFDEVKQKYFADDDRFCERSWGMSHDYHVAVQCRSTMVRVGTAIFGEREY